MNPTDSNPSQQRRHFLKSSAASVAAASLLPKVVGTCSAAESASSAESYVKVLYESLSPKQKETICYDWNHQDKKRGLLRTRVSANWQINNQEVNGDFYSNEQRDLIRKVFEGIVHPEWHASFDKQLEDDCGGFGEEQSIAIFGSPEENKFEFVLTGRHMTLRCDGNSADHVAFGGPIFYGHAPTGGDEEADHDGNVFWQQAVEANNVYKMLDGKQRALAEVSRTPGESRVAFQGKSGQFPGIPISELAADQKGQMQKVLAKLVEPFRDADRKEAMTCLEAQGGLDACHLSFFTDQDLGKDKVWDNWRVEGPSFVWHFRGAPHVHVWVNVADSPDVKLNA
ncbi:MAG: DUF3500 domain-containing protein [Planctomycetota bacterium]